MKKLVAIVLSLAMLLSACTSQRNAGLTISDSSEAVYIVSESGNGEGDSALEEVRADTSTNADELGFTVNGLDDEKLLSYVEDRVYEDIVHQLNSEEYFVENVEAVYYPKEYIEAMASNSQSNLYFGYTSAELDECFQGTRYVFTLGSDGQTTVVPMETVDDDVYVKALEDVMIGAGVILVCATVAFVSEPVAPAVSVILTASASSGAKFALESGALGFAVSAIVKGYETESFDQAFKAGMASGAEGFKWGAIFGGILGGADKAIALKGATRNGLSMNSAAKIQKDSGFPLELIKEFNSIEEYNVYKNAGLYTRMVNGNLALVRDIDPYYVATLEDGTKITNLQLMEKGKAPFDAVTGKRFDLHHINQDKDGVLAILTKSEHTGKHAILHKRAKDGVHNAMTGDKDWAKKKAAFWKALAALLKQ